VDNGQTTDMNTTWADPILTCADARALEVRLFCGDEEREWAAMQRAGAAVARAVLTDFEEIGGFPGTGRLLVLAGKGHNGGDALLAAAAILEKHPAASADVVFAFGERALRPLAARAWRQLVEKAPQRVRALAGSVSIVAGAQPRLRHSVAASASEWKSPYDICLDGVFGFQFRPPVETATAELLREVNRHPAIRLRAAVDLPSGVGEQSGDIAFRADFTYATGSVKSPLLEERNRFAAGRLRYCDLGFFDTGNAGSPLAGDPSDLSGAGSPLAGDPTDSSRAVSTDSTGSPRAGSGSATPQASSRPRACRGASALPTDFVLKPSILGPLAGLRAAQSDKRTFGHLFVIAGSRSYPGAALMCARAALRSGVGLVTVFAPESLVPTYAACAPEAIWVAWPETPDGGLSLDGLHLLRQRLPGATALVMGCGLATEPETQTLAGEIVKLAGIPVALDADALQPSILAAAAGKRVVCLPHAGEFRRLAGGREANPAVLRALARETNAVIALKGPVTQIAQGEHIYHSFCGGPVLARGGSGDLLAGLVGGLLAQAGVAERRPVPSENEDADALLLAACRGVVWHGLAADLLARDRGQVAVQATQLLDYLPAALRHSAR
jgi:NAD(P)H-hydrate epimerase